MSFTETTGFGSIVKVNDGVAQAYAAITGVSMADVPWGSVEIIKFMKLAQSNNFYNKTTGPSDLGQFTFECYYDNATYQRFVALKHLRYITGTTPVSWQVLTEDDTSTDGSMTVQFNGILDKVELPLDPTKMSVMKVTVECWGAPTITA